MDSSAHLASINPEIINKNWVATDSEIINKNCVAVDSEISSDNGVVSSFTFFFLMLGVYILPS
jgi:hypothetical protein